MRKIMRTFVTVLLVTVLQYRGTESGFTACYQCASSSLQNNWQLTGLQLPSQVVSTPSTFFLDTACDAVDPSKTTKATSCADFCFTMVIAPVAINGSIGNNAFVRGCHKDFTNFQFPSPGTIGSNTDGGKCEYGYITRYSNTTTAVRTPASYQWCNVDAGTDTPIPCNNIGASDFSAGKCVRLQNTQVTCYDCVDGSSAKPCTGSAMGQSPYCYKSDLWINNQHFVTRSLSDINPLYPGATGADNSNTQPQQAEGKCGKVAITYPAFTRASVSFNGYDCYCSAYNYCNGVGKVAVSFVTIVMASIFVVFKF